MSLAAFSLLLLTRSWHPQSNLRPCETKTSQFVCMIFYLLITYIWHTLGSVTQNLVSCWKKVLLRLWLISSVRRWIWEGLSFLQVQHNKFATGLRFSPLWDDLIKKPTSRNISTHNPPSSWRCDHKELWGVENNPTVWKQPLRCYIPLRHCCPHPKPHVIHQSKYLRPPP